MHDTRALFERLRAREPAAFEEMLGEYEGRIYDLHCWLTGDTVLAEDLTQETFLSAWRSIDGFRGEAGVLTWLSHIARNVSRQHYRKEKKTAMPLDKFENLNTHESAEDAASREMLREYIRAALQQLPPDRREVLVLNKLAGLSHGEVARVTGKPLGTVKWLIAQALDSLRIILAKKGVTGNEV